MKGAMRIGGAVLLLMGVLWIGQGLGVVKWPASSFMIDQRPWAVRGVLLVLLGCIALWAARRR